MLLACHTDLQTSHSRHLSFPRYDPWPLLHLHLLSAPVSHPSPVLLSTIKLVGYPLYGCATPPHPSSPSLRLSLAIALSLVFFIPLLLYCLHTHILIYFNPTFQPPPPTNISISQFSDMLSLFPLEGPLPLPSFRLSVPFFLQPPDTCTYDIYTLRPQKHTLNSGFSWYH